MSRAPRGLLLDFGDTVLLQKRLDRVAGSRSVLRHMTLPKGLTEPEALSVIDEVSAALRQWRDHGELEFSVFAFLRLSAERLGARLHAPELEVARAYFDASLQLEPSPHIGALLDAAEAIGCPAAIVSNSMFPADLIRQRLAHHGLAERFRFVMSSTDYGLRKPNLQLFLAAAKRLGVAPAEIWFAGDRPSRDVWGANRAGMVSIHYDVGKEAPDPAVPEQRPDRTIRDWRQLLPLSG